MTDIIFILIIFAIIFWLCDDNKSEGFASRKHPKWSSPTYDYKCVGKKSALHKVINTTYEDDLKMQNIQCIGDNVPPTKCWVFDNSKNDWTCDKQVQGDCVKLLNGKVVCSDSTDQSFMFKCNGNMDERSNPSSVGDPECKRLYDNYKIEPSLLAQGFKCEYGNGTVPIQNNNNVISGYMSPSDGKVLRAKTNVDCNEMLKNSPIDEQKVTCSEGKMGNQCVALFDKAGIYTWKDDGYDCVTVEGKQYVAKKLSDSIQFASYDGVKPIECANKLNFPMEGVAKPIVCDTATSGNRLCPIAFRELNLQPATTPTTIVPSTNANDVTPATVPPATPPNNSSSSNSSATSGMSSTTIIIIVVVVILLILLIGVTVYFLSGSKNEPANIGISEQSNPSLIGNDGVEMTTITNPLLANNLQTTTFEGEQLMQG